MKNGIFLELAPLEPGIVLNFKLFLKYRKAIVTKTIYM